MKGHLSAKTMNTYVNMAKEIVESRLDEEGEPIFARKWNNNVIDLPIVKKREQRRPKLAKEGVTAVIASCETPWERMLYILCPAGGMRIAEVLALDIDKHISSDCRVIKVRGQVKGNRIVSYLKTDAAYREVDLFPEIGVHGKQRETIKPTRHNAKQGAEAVAFAPFLYVLASVLGQNADQPSRLSFEKLGIIERIAC